MNKQELFEAYPELISEIITDALVDEANELMGYTHMFGNGMEMLARCYGLMVRDGQGFAPIRLRRLYQDGREVKPNYTG